jgi:L-ascorbate metabolism protein UlaG (beta-lactamase superfamily)
MKHQPLYLRPNVQVEPLFDQWYAWPHLIPPATAARNVTERHLKIMDSYIAAPQIHANAAKNPKMLGGPFIDLNGQRVSEIRSLRDQTKAQRPHLLQLSAAIAELDGKLREKAAGFSLQPLYREVPEPMKGYVELIYDLNNHPSFRLIEPLLYESKFYDRSAQSLMLSLITGDDRPFMLSTPRLEDEHSLPLRVPFDSPVIDELFRLKSKPQPWSETRELLGLRNGSEDLAKSFFTPDLPRPYEPYNGSGVRWRYFGHACILVESRGLSILFDPVLSYSYESNISRYTYEHLPDTIDYVVITHNHQDHILFETLLQLRHKTKNIIVPHNSGGALQDPSVKLTLEKSGFRNVIELGEMERLEFENGSIMGLPFIGEHSDLAVMTKRAYQVQIDSHKLIFAADSCNLEPKIYEHVHQVAGDADVLFLGMECDGAPLTWLYGPLLTQKIPRAMDESRRLAGCNYDQAIALVKQFNCKECYVYAMGQEPWLNYVMSLKYTEQSRPIIESNRLIEDCTRRGICAERLFGEKEILIG